MKLEGRILTNAVILGSGEFVGQVANFVFVIAFARQFGAERLGQYSLALSVGASICIFVSFGIHALLTREIGQDPERGQAAIGNWLPAELGSALTVWTGLALVSWFLPIDSDLRVALLVVGGYQIIWRVGMLFSLQFSARGLMVIPSLVDALHRLAILSLAGAAMLLHAKATTALLAFPIVAMFAVCILAWQARRAFGAPEVRWDIPTISSLVSRARSFFVMSVLEAAQGRVGIILLAAIAGNTTVGMYAAADRLLLPVILIEMLLIKAAYPAMLRLWTYDRERMQEVSSRCLRFVLLVSVPMSGFLFAFRADLIPMVYGEAFESAIASLAVLAWLPIFAGMRALWGAQAMTAHLQRQAALIKTFAIGCLLSGAILAINQHQATGLAIAVLGAEAIHAALLFVLLARHSMLPPIAKPLIGPVCAAGLAILSAMTVVGQGFFLRVSVVAGVMITGLWLFGGVRTHDIRFVADALTRQDHVG